jgi:hypothetical protein
MNFSEVSSIYRVKMEANLPTLGRIEVDLAYLDDAGMTVFSKIMTFAETWFKKDFPEQIKVSMELVEVNILGDRIWTITEELDKEEMCRIVSIMRKVLEMCPRKPLILEETRELVEESDRQVYILRNNDQSRVLGIYANKGLARSAQNLLRQANYSVCKEVSVDRLGCEQELPVIDQLGLAECSRLLIEVCGVPREKLHQTLLT